MPAAQDSFDPWRTLGVPVGAGPEEIRSAFRTLARAKHPDVNRASPHAHEQFVRLRQAYEMLMDDEVRGRLEREALGGTNLDDMLIIEAPHVTLLDAYELLERGYANEARDLYLQLVEQDPGDPRLLGLLEAIQRTENLGVAADVGARISPRPPAERDAARTHESYREMWKPEPAPVRWWLVALGALVAGLCTLGVRFVDADPAVASYSLAEIGLAALAGFAGMTLVSASGFVGSFDWALGQIIGGAGRGAPMWLYLGVAGMISPALALIFYLVSVLLQTEWSWDVAGFFATVFAIGALMGWAHGSSLLTTMLVGSSALFVPGLAGWALGSIFRPGYWWE